MGFQRELKLTVTNAQVNASLRSCIEEHFRHGPIYMQLLPKYVLDIGKIV